MIKSIHIQNFRCFEDFQLQGFGRVNLIGGMNNAGKTALLEGIAVGTTPNPRVVGNLKQRRYLDKNIFSKEPAERLWEDYFHNKQVNKNIQINSQWTGGVTFTCQYQQKKELLQEAPDLHFSYFNNNELFYIGVLGRDKEELIELKKGEYYESKHIMKDGFTSFMFTNNIAADGESQQILTRQYSKVELANQEELVLKAVKLIDESIIAIKIISLNQPKLYLQRRGEALMPLEIFGDATSKLITILLNILSNNDLRVFLIDEIENGIHYTNQPKVWETIFKLAEEFNVQIFATTHSKEMATAFANAAEKLDKQAAAKYIEMGRHHKTNKIIGLTYGVDRLQYKLERNEPFRGE